MKFKITANGSKFFWQPEILNEVLDKEVKGLLKNLKDSALREIDHNLSTMTMPYSTGRLRAATRASILKDGKRLRIWNSVRNNTAKGPRHRYAQYVEGGRPPVIAKGEKPLTWKQGISWVSKRSVRAVPPRPFFFKGVKKALNKELAIFGENIDKTFEDINSRLTSRKF
tara:strand:- start:5042 stop:5548 length:507 start_codon:yes stop_codon:yes gene_type:complete